MSRPAAQISDVPTASQLSDSDDLSDGGLALRARNACRTALRYAARADAAVNRYAPIVEREALLYELGHVIFQAAIADGRTDIFTREAQSSQGYLTLFNHSWEDNFIFCGRIGEQHCVRLLLDV